MLNLAEYRQRPALLADWLPWAGLVAPGVVLNKDGSFQRTFQFRGPDLDSATQGELIATSARQNNALRRTGSGWAFYIEAERMRASSYPQSSFPEPLSWLVDEERRAAFEESDGHFESVYHFTLQHLPPQESRARAAGMLYENRPTEGVDWRGRLDSFVAETDRVFDLLDGVMPEIAWLDDSQTLTYLHATVSTRRYRVGVPDVPFHIDALLADAALVGGLAPMLGDQHLRVVSVRGFPTSTWPGILDDLNRLGFAYRWSTRFLCLDKAEAERELGRLRRQWFAKRKNVIALLRETIFQQESPLVDTDASNKAADADAVRQHAVQAAQQAGEARANHCAQHREAVFQVDTVHRWLGDPEIGGDRRRYRDFTFILLAAGDDDADHRRRLGNIRQRNQRPHRGAAHALDHLHIDSEGGLVDTGNHQRRVEEAEQRGADRREAAG